MKEILINKVGVTTYADNGAGVAITNISSLATVLEGALVCMNLDGTVVTPGVAPTTSKVYFAIGRATGQGSKVSVPIDRLSLEYSSKVYSAPVAQIAAIGQAAIAATLQSLNLPTITAGLSAEVIIEDATKPHYDKTRRRTYEYVTQTGDVADNIVDGIVALVNADTDAIVTAAAVDVGGLGVGITFTSNTAGNEVKIGVRGILDDADITYGAILKAAGTNVGTAAIVNNEYYDNATTTTLAAKTGSATLNTRANFIGSGTPTQVAELYREAIAEDGYNDDNVPANLLWKVTSPVETTATYTIYTLQWYNERKWSHHNLSLPDRQELLICVPSANAAITAAMDALLLSF